MDFFSYPFTGTYSGLTTFFSLEYLILFLPLCLLLYFFFPSKSKKYLLLFLSYLFFWLVSGKLVVYLFASTLFAFGFGRVLEKIKSKRDDTLKSTEKQQRKKVKQSFQRKSRIALGIAIMLHIGLLLTLKYSAFFVINFNDFLSLLGFQVQLTVPNFLLPIGLSFFTLQILSYLVDVYRNTIKADENFFRLALFISFFPQIVEGPICRYSQTAQQLWSVKQIEFNNFSMGMQRFLYGMMKKIVIADRLNPLIDSVFESPSDYGGIMVVVASVAYTIQLYMDFSGAMDAVVGISQVFGVTMPENFKRPFFSKSISEFWTRWHITLGTWFKDYIFYPVSMSKKMKALTTNARKKIGIYYGPLVAGSIALSCVWLLNGLWHGSAWNYIFFGIYHWFLILLGNVFTPLSKRILSKFKINSDSNGYSLFKIFRTFILVVIGELFFRAEGLQHGLNMFFSIFNDFRLPAVEKPFLDDFGLSFLELVVLAVSLIMVLFTSILNEKNISIREKIKNKNIVIRWMAIYAMIVFIVIFGAYGDGYIQLDPIYANF